MGNACVHTYICIFGRFVVLFLKKVCNDTSQVVLDVLAISRKASDFILLMAVSVITFGEFRQWLAGRALVVCLHGVLYRMHSSRMADSVPH